MTTSTPLTDDFEERLAAAKQRERRRATLFVVFWALGILAVVLVIYAGNRRLSGMQAGLEAAQAALEASQGKLKVLQDASEIAAKAADDAKTSAAAVDKLSKALQMDQGRMQDEQEKLKAQIRDQDENRRALDNQLRALKSQLDDARKNLDDARRAVVIAANDADAAARRANQATTSADTALQNARSAGETATKAEAAAKAAQTQAENMKSELDRQQELAAERFNKIERSLARAHYTFNTNKTNEIFDVYLYFGGWDSKRGGIQNLCVALSKDKAHSQVAGHIWDIVTDVFRPSRPPDKPDCLAIKSIKDNKVTDYSPDSFDPNKRLKFLRAGDSITFKTEEWTYTLTPRYWINLKISHDQVGFDVEREPIRKTDGSVAGSTVQR